MSRNTVVGTYKRYKTTRAGKHGEQINLESLIKDWFPETEVINEQGVEPNWTKEFPVIGQGTIIFNILRRTPFSLVVKQNNSSDWLALYVHYDSVRFLLKRDSKVDVIASRKGEDVGLDPKRKVSYWLSYDRDNMVVKYGKGYRMEETTLLKVNFLKGLDNEKQKIMRNHMSSIFSGVQQKVIEQYDVLDKDDMREYYEDTAKDETEKINPVGVIDIEGTVAFDKEPVTFNLPALIKDSLDVTLLDIDNGHHIFSASLPTANQELYNNIKGINIDWLTAVDNCKLTDAIRHSIATKGCALYKKLEEKAKGMKDPSMTYLRVTLGIGRGCSPGIPYVLEIWPKDHYSPIHDHGNSHAVIKVLHGGITSYFYNKQVLTHDSTDELQKALFKAELKAGDFTWLSPSWYQTHKLKNSTGDFCATLQCYKYAHDDTNHWPFFDYLGEARQIAEFMPNSDFTFAELRKTLIAEYLGRKK